MTKPWDLHEATIKKLYAENTLADVRIIMIDKYNFKASTRAYRGRFVKWGVRKYNRRRSDRSSTSIRSLDGSTSPSDIAFVTSPHRRRKTNCGLARCSIAGHSMDGERTTSCSPNATDIDSPQANAESRPLVSPAQAVPYEWTASPDPQSPFSPDFNHPCTEGGSPSYYEYAPLSPASSPYAGIAYDYESDCYSNQGFPVWPPQIYGGNIHAVLA